MNYDQITGIIRAIVPALLAWFVAKGDLSTSTTTDITAAVVAVGAAVWSVLNNRSGKIISPSITGR